MSMSLALSTCVFFVSVMQSVNGAQFLNATLLPLSSACLTAASAPAPVFLILPLTRLHASL